MGIWFGAVVGLFSRCKASWIRCFIGFAPSFNVFPDFFGVGVSLVYIMNTNGINTELIYEHPDTANIVLAGKALVGGAILWKNWIII